MSNRNIRSRHETEKKKIVPDHDLVATHPLADRIKKIEFKNKLSGSGGSPVGRIQNMITDLRSLTSKTYTTMKTNYWDLNGVIETEEELEEHLDWMFDQVYLYAEKAKDLMREHRKELLVIKQAREIKNGQ